MRLFQAIIFLIFLIAVALFAVQNTQGVTVWFLTWGLSSSLAIVIVSAYLLGMLSGWTVVAFVGRSLRRVTERRE